MPFLSMLSPLKFLLDPKVLIILAISGFVAFHFYKVNSLNTKLNEVSTNFIVLTNTNNKNIETIEKLERDLNNSKEQSSILSDSYSDEIKQLKAVIVEMGKKPVFTKTIIVKDSNNSECSIKVKQLQPEDGNSILKIISEIGKIE